MLDWDSTMLVVGPRGSLTVKRVGVPATPAAVPDAKGDPVGMEIAPAAAAVAVNAKEQLALAASAPPDKVAAPPLMALIATLPPQVLLATASGVTPAGMVGASVTALNGVALGFVSVTVAVVASPLKTI
jgi:hypothetical protein